MPLPLPFNFDSFATLATLSTFASCAAIALAGRAFAVSSLATTKCVFAAPRSLISTAFRIERITMDLV